MKYKVRVFARFDVIVDTDSIKKAFERAVDVVSLEYCWGDADDVMAVSVTKAITETETYDVLRAKECVEFDNRKWNLRRKRERKLETKRINRELKLRR